MKLDDVFGKIHQLPTMPKVVQELIDSFNKDDVDVHAVASRVALDQVISAKVLRLANSSHYGGARKVGSVDDAVVVLGFNALRTLVVASGVTGAFQNAAGFDRKSYWQHCLAVAATAKQLAKHAKVSGELAFTTGLIHNIGELLIHLYAPDLAGKIDRQVAAGGNRINLEDTQIGFDYVDVGAELARRWNFPNEVVDAIAFQNKPAQQLPPSTLTHVLALAIYVVDWLDSGEGPEKLVDGFPTALGTVVQVSANQVAAEIDTIREQIAGFEGLHQ